MHPFIFLCSFGLLFSLPFQSLFVASQPDSNIDQPSLFDINSKPKKSFETVIKAADYTYLMRVDFQTDNGETKKSTFATLDTGSDLIWLNSTNCNGDIYGYCKDSQAKCHPGKGECDKCDKFCKELCKLPWPKDKQKPPECSKHTYPYNTSYGDKFTTHGNLPPKKKCDEFCKELGQTKQPECSGCNWPYNIIYGDGSTTEGKLTRSEFSWSVSGSDDHKEPHKIWFGVPTVARGQMESEKSVKGGIVGLGRGELSLISQLIEPARFAFSLSYCLPPRNSKSRTKLRLGDQATIPDKSVNLLPKNSQGCTNRYCVSLTQISINEGKPIPVSNENKLLIDTGTTLTLFHKKLFEDFIKEVEGLDVGEPIELGKYSHCYEKENGKKLKSVSLKFDDKMSIELERDNYFVDYKHEEKEYSCLTVIENKLEGTPNFLGSWAQVNFNVVIGDFDKNDGNGMVSFEKTTKGCVEEHKEEQVSDFQEKY